MSLESYCSFAIGMATISEIKRRHGEENLVQQSTDTVDRDVMKLAETLLLCQSELAQVREEQEPLVEQWMQWRYESANAKAISAHLATGLAKHLSRSFWEQHEPREAISLRRFISSRWPWIRKLSARCRSTPVSEEAECIKLIEASSLFRPVWYLQQHVDVARTCSNPSTHYLLYGANEGRDPGPKFSTVEYLERHPEVAEMGINPLVHYLRSTPK